MKMLKAILTSLLSVIFLSVIVSGFRCYVCNTELAGAPSENKTRGYAVVGEHGCIQTESHDNCTACMKVLTTVSFHETKSGVIEKTIMTKSCVQSAAFNEKESCDSTGSKRDSGITCFCKSDLCNHSPCPYMSATTVMFATLFIAVLRTA